MKAQIIKIGNSKGIRIPKVVLEQAQIADQVEMEVVNKQIVIKPSTRPRQGWKEAFQSSTHEEPEKELREWAKVSSKWDRKEWEWK
jgi:antitoxin MazE